MDNPLPSAISAAIDGYPEPARAQFMALRARLHEIAGAIAGTGGLTETLKWGEPSFAPVKGRVGTPVRLAWKAARPDAISLFVNCQTSLVETWRAQYPELEFVGNRELIIPLSGAIPPDIAACMRDALTYHLRKAGHPTV